MKFPMIVALALLLPVGVASAQTTPASPNAVATANAPAAGDMPKSKADTRKEKVKDERQSCRSDAQGKGLKGEAMHSAVQQCMAQIDPKAAKRMGCVRTAKDQNLAGDDMKKSVRQCMTGA